MGPTFVRKGNCPPERCKGKCCTFLGNWLRGPEGDIEKVVYFMRTRGIPVVKHPDEDLYWWAIPQVCQHLTPEGLCGIYDKPERPKICSDFPEEPSQLMGLDGYCGFYFEETPA